MDQSAPPQIPQTIIQAPPQNILGNRPCVVTCPSCKAHQLSRVTYEVCSKTHLTSLLVCVLCGCCGCFLIPYFMKSFKTANHKCGKCGCFIGTFTS
nr:lipopolysaccharide-induced tumor necrosis factor-alpha factor homolog [Drosophila bipectinata]